MSRRNRNRNYETVAVMDKAEERQRSPIKYVLEEQKLRTRQDLLKLRLAIDSAENITNFDRQLLHDIYRDIVKDPNLSSQWNSRKMKTLSRSFKVVTQSGEENEELSLIFQNDWFYNFLSHALDSHLWGFTMMEFGNWDGTTFMPYMVNGKLYDGVNLIDRDNVKPELGIITSTPGQNTGIKFNDPEYGTNLMFIGRYRDSLDCILFKAAKYILFKDNCLGNWSEWAEVFGMDKRVGYTRTRDGERDKFLKAMRDLGANSYGVFNEGDKVEYIGSQRTDAFKVYHEMVKYIDEQVSKLIFGQDVVSNNTGRVVGTVGENMANMYGDADGRFIEGVVNTKLMPFLSDLGVNTKDARFMWDTTEKLGLKERSEVDLNVSKMGQKLSAEYLEETYGIEVDETEPEESQQELREQISNFYRV